jgi:hypothetical protein
MRSGNMTLSKLGDNLLKIIKNHLGWTLQKITLWFVKQLTFNFKCIINQTIFWKCLEFEWNKSDMILTFVEKHMKKGFYQYFTMFFILFFKFKTSVACAVGPSVNTFFIFHIFWIENF